MKYQPEQGAPVCIQSTPAGLVFVASPPMSGADPTMVIYLGKYSAPADFRKPDTFSSTPSSAGGRQHQTFHCFYTKLLVLCHKDSKATGLACYPQKFSRTKLEKVLSHFLTSEPPASSPHWASFCLRCLSAAPSTP